MFRHKVLGGATEMWGIVRTGCTLSDLDQYGEMASWKIRPAVAQDAAPLAKCVDAAYASYRERIKDLPPVSEGIAEDIKSNLVWVAELDHSIVGGLILVLKDEFAMLADIAVDPDCAGMGIGRGLIEHAETQSRKVEEGRTPPEHVCRNAREC